MTEREAPCSRCGSDWHYTDEHDGPKTKPGQEFADALYGLGGPGDAALLHPRQAIAAIEMAAVDEAVKQMETLAESDAAVSFALPEIRRVLGR